MSDTYFREDETRQQIENWVRWAGDGSGSPTSRELNVDKLHEREDFRGQALPKSAVIGEDARITGEVMKTLHWRSRKLLINYHLRTTDLKSLAATIKVSVRWAQTMLHQAHSDFWDVHADVADNARSVRRVTAATQPVLPDGGEYAIAKARPKPMPGPVVIENHK